MKLITGPFPVLRILRFGVVNYALDVYFTSLMPEIITGNRIYVTFDYLWRWAFTPVLAVYFKELSL